MSRDNARSLEQIIWEIRHVAIHEGDALSIDGAILALADCLERRGDLDTTDRRAILQGAALLWRAGFRLAQAEKADVTGAH